MNRSYTEKQVLKKLKIPDFRHLAKDKVIAFASMVPQMNPEVAKKALEQFPNFASAALDVMREYKGILVDTMEDDRESTQTCYDMYDRVMASLERALEEDALAFEEKTYILRLMKEIADSVSQKDSEKTNNRMKLLGIAGGVAVSIVAILGSVLGSSIALRQNHISDEDEPTNEFE